MKSRKSSMVRKITVLVGGLAMMVALPACGVAGVMDPTERAPRPDPAVESGQVENPLEIREDEGDGEGADERPEENPPEGNPPGNEASGNEASGNDGASENDGASGSAPPSGNAGGESESSTPGFAPVEGSKGKDGKGGKGNAAFAGNFAPLEDGVRQVGEAGEVEFRVEDGILNLVDVSANSGWDYQLGKQDFDEVKVFFIGDEARWEFGAEIDDGYILEVETKQEIPSARPGTYEVGDAGEVSFSTADGRIILDDYGVAEGWSANIEENDFEDVHLKFLGEGGAEYKFEAEYDDGIIEVEIDGKERGTIAAS
ncbi:MAG: hypothetical protein M3494_04020 [Actinomycetota bacterium]|jgi:hypothetical protein|nr:hypothetical protein [Actinomycetota bacterium]